MIDFGMACKFQDGEVLTELCGSPHYLAPEMIGQRYNYLADVWAFGVLMFLIMYGRYPYDSKQPRDIMVKIVTEPIKWSTKLKLSGDAGRFLRKLLEHDPKRRVNTAQALEQSWIISCTDEVNAEAEALPAEVVRSAHKKVTAQRKQVDPKVEELRNRKLKKIDDDYSRGIVRGRRLGDTCLEEGFTTKPEFMRRENKLFTAPSNQIALSRLTEQLNTDNYNKQHPELVPDQLSGVLGDKSSSSSSFLEVSFASRAPAGLSGAAPTAATQDHIVPNRCNSLCNPRCLSYMGHISTREESTFRNLCCESNSATAENSMDTAVPEAAPEPREGTPSFNGVVATEELV